MLVVGIAGGTGSGKTTVVEKVMAQLPENRVALLPQDAYYRDHGHLSPAERQEVNFDHPRSIEFSLLADHIRQLKIGRDIDRPVYSYLSCTRSRETVRVESREVILIEGILILTDAELRELIDVKVYVDADADDRLGRVISRDISERGRTAEKVLERYEKSVKPMHLQFVEPSKRYADIIIPGGGRNQVGIELLISLILNRLG